MSNQSPDRVLNSVDSFPDRADRDLLSRLERILQLALQVANDVIPFDAHRVYVSSATMERTWNYQSGFIEGEDAEHELQRSRAFAQRLDGGKLGVEIEENRRKIYLTPLRLDPLKGLGYLAVARRVGAVRSGTVIQNQAAVSFTKPEIHQLRLVARLIELALATEEVEALLRRLHLLFLDQRTLLQVHDFSYVLREYLYKAAHLCHGIQLEAWDTETEPALTQPADKVRLTVKLINETGSALVAWQCLSNDPSEWTETQRAKVYPLPNSEQDPISFAATAYLTCRVACTNNYQQEVHETYRVFPDTSRHMSAPIVAGPGRVLGVLSVETNEGPEYTTAMQAAFTLLAAHAAWPISRAYQEDDSSRQAGIFAGELSLRSGTTERQLLETFGKKLDELGYHRGQILSSVPAETTEGDPVSWGSERPETSEPETHACAIYHVLDNHGRPLWTVQVERRDVAPLNEVDKDRILSLGGLVMKAWEEERRIQVERDWTEQILLGPFFSLEPLLGKLVDLAVAQPKVGGERIFTRGRVFRTDLDGEGTPSQVLIHQAGKDQWEDLQELRLNHPDDQAILNSTKPILFVRKGSTTRLQSGNEFEVITGVDDPHETRLHNEGRTEWVELPVRWNEKTVAKVVLDHLGTPHSAFTLGEMRLVARLARLLQIATEAVDAYKVTAHLCCRGLHIKLLEHYYGRSLDCLRRTVLASDRDKITQVQEAVQRMLDLTRMLNDALRKVRDGESEFTRQPPTVQEQLTQLEEMSMRMLVDYNIANIRVSTEGLAAHALTRGNDSFLLILLTLLENACKFVRNKATQQQQLGDAALEGKGEVPAEPQPAPTSIDTSTLIEVTARPNERDPNRVHVRVSDWGSGMNAEKVGTVRDVLSNPANWLAHTRNGEGGLVLAAFLAKEEGWQLQLCQPTSPTEFELIVQTERVETTDVSGEG